MLEVEIPVITFLFNCIAADNLSEAVDKMETEEMDRKEEDDEDAFASPEQLAHDLITLANLPTSRWLNLLSLEAIRARNRPANPVAKPRAAPFFLPTVTGLQTKFDLGDNNENGKGSF